jgi:hypothetical protein
MQKLEVIHYENLLILWHWLRIGSQPFRNLE